MQFILNPNDLHLPGQAKLWMVLLLEMELNEQGGEHLSCLGHQFRVFFRQQHGASTCDNLSPVHYLLQINAVSTCSNTFLQLYNLDYQLKSSKHPLPKNTSLPPHHSRQCEHSYFQILWFCFTYHFHLFSSIKL